MIHILFVGGSFGSMLEWGIRNYTGHYNAVDTAMTEDGSMHNFDKMYHPFDDSDYDAHAVLDKIVNLPKDSIITATYPNAKISIQEIIEFFKQPEFEKDTVINVTVPNIDVAEKILLMNYHKLVVGLGYGFDYFCLKHERNIINWNTNYKNWRDMQTWEFREWISLFYHEYVQEWIDAQQYCDPSWVKINPINIVRFYDEVIATVISYSRLTYADNLDADVKVQEWCSKQEEIFQEHEQAKLIVDKTISNEYMEWLPMNVMAEAIIQKRLRDRGYELRCFDLNTFPSNTNDLRNLIDATARTQ